jgi:hypothetical protein
MWYSYYVNNAGVAVKGKTFDTMKDFIKYASKRPKMGLMVSNTEPNLLGRAYSADPQFQR